MADEDDTTKVLVNGDASKASPGETGQTPKDALKDAFNKFNADPPAKGVSRRGRSTSSGGDPDGEEEDLLKAIQDRQDEFLGSLAKPSRLKKMWLKVWRRSHPELLKVYGIIHSNLGEAQRLLAERRDDPPAGFGEVERQLRCLLAKSRTQSYTTNVHAAWEFAGSLERALLLLGDDNYIITRLEGELEREQKKRPGSWSEHLAIEKLNHLLDNYKPGDQTGLRDCAVERLAFLHMSRTGFMRHQRAREELKADYLNRLTFVLTLLLLLLLEAIYLATNAGAAARLSRGVWETVGMLVTLDLKLDLTNPEIRNALVAAMTGALGSTLSGFYRLRDEAGDSIATLRSFRSAMWAQPFVGATVGVLLMLLIMSGVLAIGTPGAEPKLSWLSLAVYCFFAGFSEPFFLGVVQRVAGAADKKAGNAAGGGAAGGRGAAAGGGGAAGNAAG